MPVSLIIRRRGMAELASGAKFFGLAGESEDECGAAGPSSDVSNFAQYFIKLGGSLIIGIVRVACGGSRLRATH